VTRPSTTPCIVNLFSDIAFANFNPKTFLYVPPRECPGPWAKVVFTSDISVTAGTQYDRTANFWIGPTNIYFGTTAEPGQTLSPSWHVESDLTEYSSLFANGQQGTADIGNLFNQTYNGIIYATANLEFYPLQEGQAPPASADQIYALSAGPTGGTVALYTTTDQLTGTFSLPLNVERAYLDVYAQSQSSDEFWYTCVPNDVSGERFSCGNTAFREAEVMVDGSPVGVAPVFPWIFTGGIDPYLWFPLPGVQTLNFKPYRVDLTPFAGQLSNGQQHTVAISVYNADSYFSATGSLLVYLDHGSSAVTGAVTTNTLSASPSPVVKENINVAGNGDISGGVNVQSGRNFTISGYANTSHGTVTTTVNQSIQFSNRQQFVINGSRYTQNISQGTAIGSTTTTSGSGGTAQVRQQFNWPLTVDISEVFHADGSFDIITGINQQYSKQETESTGGTTTYTSSLSNTENSTDTLLISSSGNLVGNQGQKSTQNYTFTDSTGACYNLTLGAANNALSNVNYVCGPEPQK
jgi:hypothetical protein